MTLKIVDKKCENCGEFYLDTFDKDVKVCDICGGTLKRIYGLYKFREYPEGIYEHFESDNGKPVYIKDRQHFWKECKKQGLEPVSKSLIKEMQRNRKYK